MAVVFRTQEKPEVGPIMDRAAICISAVCVVQCLLLPLLVIVTPLISLGFFGEEIFHWTLLGFVLPISLVAFYMGYRVHHNARLLVPGLIGLGVVVMAAILEATVLSQLATALITSVGGALLIAGHWLNLKKRRQACLRPNR